MKVMNVFLITFLFFALTISCKKTEYVKMKPQLKIIVNDASNKPVANASVDLYKSMADFQNHTSPIVSSTTDANGLVLFSDLEEINYYFFVEANEKSNYFGISATSKPLETGVILSITTNIN